MRVTKCLAVFFIILCGVSMHAKADPTYVELEAQGVLMRYFDALTQGDIFSMGQLMGGQLLETRSRLLDNPGYPASLIDTYGRAQFSVERIQSIGRTDVLIDVSISFSPQEEGHARRQYLLRRDPPSYRAPMEPFRVHVETIAGHL